MHRKSVRTLLGVSVTRKGRSITLSLEESDKTQLEEIALELSLKWGDEPNISGLVKAIARRQLLVMPNNDWSRDLIDTLNKARNLLIDAGDLQSAQCLAELLLSRSELTIPLRTELQQFLDNPSPVWRQTLEQYVRGQRPFQLAYRDAADRLWHFTIHHAQITPLEKRQYLQCWCDETEGNTDLSALQHNWTLRLDRIPEAAIAPIKAKWRPELDQLSVELHLSGGLAFAYEPKPSDAEVEWLPEQPQVKRVVRQVSSTFWLFREIMPYGEDCLIVSPESVRDRFKAKVRSLAQHYDL
jgi:hypothetical protein